VKLHRITIYLIVIFLLQGCSYAGTLIIYNNTSSIITVSLLGELYEGKKYEVASNSVGELTINANLKNRLSIATQGKQLCYQVPVIHLNWVLEGPKVLARLEENGAINIYSKSFNETDFYLKESVEQPKGFPLQAGSCNE